MITRREKNYLKVKFLPESAFELEINYAKRRVSLSKEVASFNSLT